MPYGDIETFHQDGRWRNRVEGADTLLESHDTKAEAIVVGRHEAQQRGVEHIIKNMDGTIGDRSTYGNDPRDIPG
jgi:hypothetical protein